MDHYDRKRSKVRKKGSERIILIKKDQIRKEKGSERIKMIENDQNDQKGSFGV